MSVIFILCYCKKNKKREKIKIKKNQEKIKKKLRINKKKSRKKTTNLALIW